MADNLKKKPKKGILKNSSSFDAPEHSKQKKAKNKETKWDEMNIIATLHPPDKDYGHMKVDEPKTPFNYEDHVDSSKDLDVNALAAKIRLGEHKPPKVLQSYSMEDEDDDDDDEDLTPEEKQKKKEFESKRKKHYNEYYAVKLAKKLLEEEEEEEDDKDKKKQNNVKDKSRTGAKSANDDSSGQSSDDL